MNLLCTKMPIMLHENTSNISVFLVGQNPCQDQICESLSFVNVRNYCSHISYISYIENRNDYTTFPSHYYLNSPLLYACFP